jgi:predicted metal-binding protein
MLRTSLPDKVFEKFSQALSRDALSAAAVEGLVTCHHCSVQMLMEPDAGKYIVSALTAGEALLVSSAEIIRCSSDVTVTCMAFAF